jgi:hypothetical protein
MAFGSGGPTTMKYASTKITFLGLLGLAALFPYGSAKAVGVSSSLLTGHLIDEPVESPTASGVKHRNHPQGPIVINWKIKVGTKKAKVIDGVKYEPVDKPADVNLTVNEDGSWNFSGNFPEKPDHDIDVVMGLRSSEGSIVLFRYSGPMAHGVDFNKTGVSQTIKDNFKAFRHESWTANYRMPETSEGIAKMYEERKKRKEDEEKSKKHREEEKEKQEVAAEVARRKNHDGGSSSGGGGGSSLLGDVANTLANGVSDVTGAVGGVISDVGSSILSIF